MNTLIFCYTLNFILFYSRHWQERRNDVSIPNGLFRHQTRPLGYRNESTYRPRRQHLRKASERVRTPHGEDFARI